MIYLDHAATSPPLEIIRRRLPELLDNFANPSAAHPPGEIARKAIENCRRILTTDFRLPRRNLRFTASGTLANNIVIASFRGRPGKILTTGIEHPAVRLAITATGNKIVTIPMKDGQLDLSALEEQLTAGPVSLVSMMAVNNETGLQLPLTEVGERIRRLSPSTCFHVDGVQSFLRADPDLSRAGIDFYTFSAHKVGGLKGAGGIFCRQSPEEHLRAIWQGGGQEEGLVSGTENTLAIEALSLARDEWQMGRTDCLNRWNAFQQRLTLALQDHPAIELLPGQEMRCPWIFPLILPGCEAPSTVIRMLGEEGVAVSAGSACSTGKAVENPTLTALGYPVSWRRGLLRLSFGMTTTTADVDAFLPALHKVLQRLERTRR